MNLTNASMLLGCAAIGLAVMAAAQGYCAAASAKRYRMEIELHARSIKQSLYMLRSRCCEAINLGEVLKSPESKHFARDIGWSLLTLESEIALFLATSPVDKNESKRNRGCGPMIVRKMPLVRDDELGLETEEFFAVNPELDRLCDEPGKCADRPDVYWEELEYSGDRVLHHRRRKDGRDIPCSGRQEYYKAIASKT